MRIALICNGGNIPQIGRGHLSRCSILGKALQEKSHEAFIIIDKHSEAPDFAYFRSNEGHASLLDILKPDTIIVDTLGHEKRFMQVAKARCKTLISLDDTRVSAKYADFTINGNFGNGTYSGSKYVITNPNLDCSKRILKPHVNKVVISFGGYDHLNLKEKAIRALKDYDVIAPTRENYAKSLREADIALTNGGLTMFDAMAVGTPTISIAQYLHQERVAIQYPHAVDYLGRGEKVTEKDIQMAVSMMDYYERKYRSKNSQKYVDGKGLKRVVELVLR